MFLFGSACSDLEILGHLAEFLEIGDLLNLALINSRMYELLYGIETIELRIIKTKLKYYENRAIKSRFEWNDYQVEKWGSQNLALMNAKLNISKGCKTDKTKFNLASVIFNLNGKNSQKKE